MAIERLSRSFSIDQERLKLLEQVVPEAFADGRLRWETLKEGLREYLEDEELEVEHFGLTWPGKREARRLASLPSKGTLVPVPGEGVDEKTTGNIFIEGDNLEALKLLQKSYAGQIKMIYIDPPYNTGNDFIYKDDFKEPLVEYLRKTEQTNDEGLLTTNPRSSGRFHSNWLNMMYPRLRLARNLLRDDGVIFISIDDKEVHHLKSIMNEIFGEENFVTQIEWQKRYTRSNNTDGFTSVIDHILLYSKTVEFSPQLFERDETADARYSNPDNDPRGPWKLIPFLNPLAPEQRRNLCYEIVNPYTGEKIFPAKKAWRSSKTVYEKLFADNRVYWGSNGRAKTPGIKRFLSEVRQGMTPINFWDYQFAGHTDIANAEIKSFFGDKVFDTPKPTLLIRRMLQLATEPNTEDLIMDFFTGSGTTAEAVIAENKERGGNRKFILVQLPEVITANYPAHKLGYKTISEITKERIRRFRKKLLAELSGENQLRDEALDIGFKVFKLQKSNFKAWQDYHGDDVQVLQTTFLDLENPLKEGWKEQDVVMETLILEGFPLDTKVTVQAQFSSNTVLLAESDFVEHKLFICLNNWIEDETIQQLQLLHKDVFICLDSALSDKAKMQLSDICNIKTI